MAVRQARNVAAIAVLLHAVAVAVNVIPKIEFQKRKRSENFAFFFDIRLNQENIVKNM